MSLRGGLGVVISALLFGGSALAEIVVPPGSYEVGALLRTVAKSKKIEAVFNLRSRAECRVRLTGLKAEALRVTRPIGRWIRFAVSTEVNCGVIEAELLAVEELKGRKIPLRVGNGFKSAP